MTALAEHFPTGCWHQPDNSYAGECSCGASFVGPSYAEAKQAWAKHVAVNAFRSGTVSDAGYMVTLENAMTFAQQMIASRAPAVAIGAGRMTEEWCLNMARLEEGQEIGAGALDHPLRTKCEVPPAGWVCSREPGHDGPCAATAVAIGAGEVGDNLSDFASLMVDEVIAKVRIQLDAGESLSVSDQRLMLEQLIVERRRLQSALAPASASIPADVERVLVQLDEAQAWTANHEDAEDDPFQDQQHLLLDAARIIRALAARPSTGEKAS